MVGAEWASLYLECARLGSRMPGLLSLFSTPSYEIVPFAHQLRLGKHMLKWHDIRKINCCKIWRLKSSSFPDQNSMNGSVIQMVCTQGDLQSDTVVLKLHRGDPH